MKVSLNWIKEYVNIPESLDLKKLAFDLTMSTVEVEDVIDLSKQYDKITVGVITEVTPHPNADRLRICKTDIGNGDIREIVCGGSNVAQGMKIVVANPGAMVRWHGEGDLVEIKNAKLRGVQSYGMICASSEVGLADLFPSVEESEIMDLSEFDAFAGQSLADALELNDIILEIDNKSMTNRPDLWGHYGIAREIAALYDLTLRPWEPFTPPVTADFTISVEDPTGCPRYMGILLEGLHVKPSPFWMKSRIWRVGLRPINALVDITNYVMLAIGQPTHAFDADNISGHITVRRAKEGEKLLLLNAAELSLTTQDLVIADDTTPVGLAGVMGGAKDSVLPTTNRVILEIANFDALTIRRTAARYETRTEAATRYEKAIDPNRCDSALSLAMQLFTTLYPDHTVKGFRDVYAQPQPPVQIVLSQKWLERRLGKAIPAETIADKLGRLGFTVLFDGDQMQVTVPSWRATGDVSIKADIMEEVARMIGYENFEPAPITTTFSGAINQLDIALERKMKEYLAIRCGLQEIFTYPWMQDQFRDAILGSSKGQLFLAAPPSPDESSLRSSLLPNLCKAVTVNQHTYEEFGIFESAQILKDTQYEAVYDDRELLPLQRRMIAGALVGKTQEIESLFRSAKGILFAMPRYTHMEAFHFEKKEKPYWADDVVWLNIFVGEQIVGNLGLLSGKASMECGIKNRVIVLFELDVDAMKPFLSRTNQFEHLPEYPMTQYDASLLVDLSVQWEQIEAIVTEKKGEWIREVSFVDEYRGKQIPEDQKSVTIRLLVGSTEKTLTSAEIEKAASTVLKRLEKRLNAKLRDK